MKRGTPNHPKTYLVYVTTANNADKKKDFLDTWLQILSKNDGIITKTVITYGGLMSDDYMTPYSCDVLRKPRLVVAWNGDVSICNLDVNMQKTVGNILERDIAEIVDSRAYKYQIDVIKERRGICDGCFDANNHKHTTIHHGRADA